MPDGSRKGPLYEDDFYAWTQHQAEVLRTLQTTDNRFDREHVAEEIEDLGKSERNAVFSEIRRILEHFLKLQYSPATEPRSDGMVSVATARAELDERLTATLRREAETSLPRIYRRARSIAQAALLRYQEDRAGATLPLDCPFTLDQILAENWYPEPLKEVK